MTQFLHRKSIPFLCLAFLVTGTGYARSQGAGKMMSVHSDRSQVNGQVRGQITSEKGEALPGVTVLVKGTTVGTATDASGRYELNVPDNATLVISFIGYNTQEVAVGNRSTVNVSLILDSKALEEVVVVGYGTVRKSDLTGSVSSIKGSAVREFPVVSVDQALQGRAAGVQVSQASAAPGGGLSVRVRGSNSINSGSEPLYVIDGFPIYPDNAAFGTGGNRQSANALASLNPNDIESIEV
ncbi:MAG: TonB-dependent receptor, partial [Adhaeribacter sp.]|nr:TonB-dependent receptor [Adhaeribacter sp.]